MLDFMFTLVSAGCAGVNMETGVNQLGFISSYSPISDDEQGHYWAAPEYYGMLVFAQSGAGRLVEATVNSNDDSIKAYAVERSKDCIVLTVINKRSSVDATLVIDNERSLSFKKASLLRLVGPSLESKSGVSFGGKRVAPDGTWSPGRTEDVPLIAGKLKMSVPASGAAIVTLHL